MGAAARTRSPSARHAAATPTASRGPQRAEAPGRLPHPGQRGTAPAPQGRCDRSPPHGTRPSPRADRDRDRPARSPRPAMPDTIAEQLAHQQGGVIPARVPGTEHPAHERAGDSRPLRPPGHRHALPDLRPSHQRTRLPRPPRPRQITGAGRPCVRIHARLSGSRQAGTRDQRGPSVAVRGKPTVHTDRPGGRRPSAICPCPRASRRHIARTATDAVRKIA
jgi:hypothetical protein